MAADQQKLKLSGFFKNRMNVLANLLSTSLSLTNKHKYMHFCESFQ